MKRLSGTSLAEFLALRPYSVVHVDAEWDGYSKAIADKIRKIEPQFEETASFGYVDCDAEQELASKIGLRNVPSVAYYSGTKLVGLVIGIQQDVAANIERMKRGEQLDQKNLVSRG
jgi:thioredoxin-like negative regulator of GroEL